MSSEAKRAFLWKADVLVRVLGSRSIVSVRAGGSFRANSDTPMVARVSAWFETTAKYLNMTAQYPHEFNERVPLTIVRARG